LALSKVLTGAADLAATLAEAYPGRLRAEFPTQVTDVLTGFAALEKEEHLVFEVRAIEQQLAKAKGWLIAKRSGIPGPRKQ
jgi:hypothetical protein